MQSNLKIERKLKIIMKKLNILLMSTFLSAASTSIQADTTNQLLTEPSVPPQAMNSVDEYESFNRSVYGFNLAFHDTIGEPVTGIYSDYVPSPIQTGLKNFFSNLTVPLDIVNSVLQGKAEQSMESFMRFVINSTFGFGGLLDIATPAGLAKKNEDFGQTLFVWGFWDEATFVMLPLLGPRTTRNLVGSATDITVDPIYSLANLDLSQTATVVGNTFVGYSEITPLIEAVRMQPDPYIFMRESYLQYRTNLIYDGNPPKADLDDFDFN